MQMAWLCLGLCTGAPYSHSERARCSVLLFVTSMFISDVNGFSLFNLVCSFRLSVKLVEMNSNPGSS